ncbi:hypothetical protein [Peribacillus loiseleuriae]|nr:hypothetical protein [Peribacillus loiseleuriae]
MRADSFCSHGRSQFGELQLLIAALRKQGAFYQHIDKKEVNHLYITGD